jgi:4-hydroxythreonine-4-phosphate dehydrogenase
MILLKIRTEKIMSTESKIKVAVSLGDFNGIGPEVVIKTFADNRMMQECIPIVYGSQKVTSYHRKVLGITDFSFTQIKDADQINLKTPSIINVWEEDTIIELGKSTETSGKYAFKSLQAAVDGLKKEKTDVLVTAPINKHNIQSEGFRFPGHTEYLAQQFDAKDVLMLMVNNDLRIGVATGHISIDKITSLLSSELILRKLKIMNRSLIEDFAIRKPRIAILGLNPHAGDNGLIGNEEEKIIIPAIRKAKENNLLVFGPYGADGFFGSGNYKNFDGILAMYHDQGLIPFKTLSFGEGVNFTAGLPIVRTSPDHGTGYDIAGKGIASENSFRQAVYVACDIFKNRKEYKEITANPLKITHLRRE